MLTWYKNEKTSVKLLTAFMALAVVVLLVGLIGLTQVKKMNGYIVDMYNDGVVMSIDFGHLNEESANIRLAALKMASGLYQNDLQAIFREAQESEKKVEELFRKQKDLVTGDERKAFETMQEAWKSYNESRLRTMNFALAGELEKARENARNDAGKKYDILDGRIEEMIEIQDKEGKALFADSARAERSATVTIVAVFLASMFAAVVAGIFISNLIADPLRKITAAAARISTGDLNVEVDVTTKDEVGILAASFREMSAYLRGMSAVAESVAKGDLRSQVTPQSDKDVLGNAFHKMIAGLRGIITEVKAGSDQTVSAAADIASAAEESARNNESAATAIEETTATMHEMAANIQNVSKNTQSQASAVTQTSASIEEMVTSVQRISNTAQQLVALSQKTKSAVEAGLDSVEKSVKSTNEISRAILRSADTIAALGSRAEDIGKIVDVIDDIADQTNLLALNAAIEAARAGEQGLGFAVVAEEVRKLAERSAKSTKEIAELISGIQKEAMDAVKLMAKSTEMVEKGVELSNQVGHSLKNIEGSVGEVDRYSKEIGAATQEQSAGSTQIARAAESLREITQEISSATDEQASAAEQIVKTMEKMREMITQNASGTAQLASSAEELNSQADRFQQVIGTFVLDEESKSPPPAVKRNSVFARNSGGKGRKMIEEYGTVGVA